MTEEHAFKAGWAAGYADGGEHDCRMFTPTAERAWKNFLFRSGRIVYDKRQGKFVSTTKEK